MHKKHMHTTIQIRCKKSIPGNPRFYSRGFNSLLAGFGNFFGVVVFPVLNQTTMNKDLLQDKSAAQGTSRSYTNSIKLPNPVRVA